MSRKERTSRQVLAPEDLRGLPNGDELCVLRRVTIQVSAVAALRYDLAFMHYDAADGIVAGGL